MIEEYRQTFNRNFTEIAYQGFLDDLASRTQSEIGFRVAETPVFLTRSLLNEMAAAGEELTHSLLSSAEYLARAGDAIPAGWIAARQTAHPNFLAADFALVPGGNGSLTPKLVEIQGFPSLYGFQLELAESYRQSFHLSEQLDLFLSGLNRQSYWELLRRTIVAGHDPAQVILLELDPLHQKTLPDFCVTCRNLGIQLVDVRELVPTGNRLNYRSAGGELVEIKRIYNRVIADELIAKQVHLPFDWQSEWEVEWAGHPNWYFLISKFSLPWLNGAQTVPPCVFLNDFLEGNGAEQLIASGVALPAGADPVYDDLLLKPLFSFAGKGIRFSPSHSELLAIEPDSRPLYLLQQRMSFEKNITTPEGMTQAEIRILYLWPDGGSLTPVLPLIRLGRGKMMGVDHNRNLRWVGASAALIDG